MENTNLNNKNIINNEQLNEQLEEKDQNIQTEEQPIFEAQINELIETEATNTDSDISDYANECGLSISKRRTH